MSKSSEMMSKSSFLMTLRRRMAALNPSYRQTSEGRMIGKYAEFTLVKTMIY